MKQNSDLQKYMGLAFQIMASLFLAVYAGIWIDKKLHSTPIFIIILPLLFLFGIFYKIYNDSNTKKSNR
jgi:F0F1-type ATP synthase assembly protein I